MSIKHMVDRFLSWKLPESFSPDNGISFQKLGNVGTVHEYRREPTGTNLLDAAQATAMVEHMAAGLELTSQAVVDVASERRRQIEGEGWTPGHDDRYRTDELARAAAVYAAGGGLFKISSLQTPMQVWPYQWEYKPADRRRELVKAGALILAAIEQIDRVAAVEQRAA